ncbi:hypothetical protein SEA_BANTAM_142 [Gordonia phage Bantam]|uniref:Uncharacterized protein n=1 Tax=Gordonia phage Bantam TaxID=1887641 RepID=A0A1B3AYM3_9CAUD|nr:hypothetical protein BIZ77_gp037 [Gordonia phage Bantam]AOE43831.1 hypothetical protein SEA_BANTAM_142 [Gordonia phage Bantam]
MMKINVEFTVEVDPSQYRKSVIGGLDMSPADIRDAVRTRAMDAILFGLPADGVDVTWVRGKGEY